MPTALWVHSLREIISWGTRTKELKTTIVEQQAAGRRYQFSFR
jgi:hypothetical protein